MFELKFHQLLLPVLAIGLFATSATTTNAASQKYVKTMPKQMRATWYSYSAKNGYSKLTITKTQLRAKLSGHKAVTLRLKPYQKHDAAKITKTQQNWFYAWQSSKGTDKYQWLETYDWGQKFGSGSYLNVAKLSKRQVLTIRSMSEHFYSGHYYASKHLAKQLQNKKYKGLDTNLVM